MFPSILWSSWEAETCQLSTRPHLDASEQRGGRASPQQDPRPPLPLPTGLAFPSPGTREPASGQWGLPSCTPGSFLFLLRSVLHTRPLENQASGGPAEGERQWQVTMWGGAGRTAGCWPAPACSRLLSLRAPASPRQRQGLPTCPQGQLLNNPPGFVPRGKKTKPSENVQTKVVGTLWRSGGGGERQVGAVGTKTKAKIILQLLGSFVGFNRFPLALVLHPMPCGEGRLGPGHCGERAGPEGALGGQRLLWKGGAGVSRTEGHCEGHPLSLLCPGVWFIFRIGPACWVEVTFWRKPQVERRGRLAARLWSRPSAACRGGLVTGSRAQWHVQR